MRSTRRPKRAPSRSSAAAVAVQLAVAGAGVPPAARLRRWARATALPGAVVTLRVVGAAEGRRLNRAFRGRDYATDVLTFVYAGAPPQGDIVLCHPVLVRAARERGIPLEAHYAHLVVHGMMHLQGHDHERDAEAARMERAEARVLAALGFPDPYTVESLQRARSGPARPRRQ